MKKLYLLAICATMLATRLYAQCAGGRYLNEIFPTVNMTTVTYSSVYNLQMDIYQPAGDTLSARPVIILAHGGSFLGGTKSDDPTVDSLCVRFAKRGYITVSIDYRLTDILHIVDSVSATDEVIKAMSDGKAAIRYFVKDAATANIYKADTDRIFIGGNSAGAVLYMHVAYLDSIGECPSYIVDAMNANGGFEGNSGNAGYTTRFNAVINLAGALNQSAFIGTGDVPSVNAQGTTDDVVPYNCGYPLTGLVHVQLCGLGVLEPVYVSKSIYHMSHVFPGDGHVPWSTDNAKLFTVDSMVTVFLYNLVCTGAVSVNDVNTQTEVSLFPNPAHDVVEFRSLQPVSDVWVFDETGRMMLHEQNINKTGTTINTQGLGSGVYFVRAKFVNDNNTPVVRKITIQ